MRHHKHSVKFGRQRSHYKATLKSLISGLIVNKSICTTKVKAKEASRMADKLITLGKEKRVVNQRKAYSILGDRRLVAVLFNEIAPLFKDRKGGYTRVMLTQKRRGDNAQMAILEFVEKPKPPEPKKKTEKIEKKSAAPAKEVLESSTNVEKEEKTAPHESKKEERKKEERKKEEHKKEVIQPKKPGKPIQKPGFFKKFFGRKGD